MEVDLMRVYISNEELLQKLAAVLKIDYIESETNIINNSNVESEVFEAFHTIHDYLLKHNKYKKPDKERMSKLW